MEPSKRALNRLSASFVRTASTDKLHCDGGGLYLKVAGNSKSWVFRFTINGKPDVMGLGSYPDVSLATARVAATECRKLKDQGINPRRHRDEEYRKRLAAQARKLTFAQCAEKYIESHRRGWKNAKHAQQWTNTLATYATPINNLAVDTIDTKLVMDCLEPIWYQIPETASRVRNRIELVLDWAAARGQRQGENPARWRGHLATLLPRKSKVAPVKHHPALKYETLPEFMTLLRERNGVAAAALEFTILTATRSGEVLGAQWSEVDFDNATWTIPPNRMKAGKSHSVPLSAPAKVLLQQMKAHYKGEFLFAGAKAGKGLSNMAMTNTLRRMGYGDFTVHGFRSTFRDWVAERTGTANIVAEMALAHSVGNAAEAAYRRGDLLEKRRILMNTWASYCESKTGQVVTINRGQHQGKLRMRAEELTNMGQ